MVDDQEARDNGTGHDTASWVTSVAAHLEREAVVAWLRANARRFSEGGFVGDALVVHGLADKIMLGKHHGR